jgi:hypothetical protein
MVDIDGWKVDVTGIAQQGQNPALVERLRAHLIDVTRLLPNRVLNVVQQATIFARQDPKGGYTPPCLHWHRDWLASNGLSERMVGCIDIPTTQTYVDHLDDWKKKGWTGSLVHEIGHAFHYHQPSFDEDDPELDALFQAAKGSAVYLNAENWLTGSKGRHYALTARPGGDPKEYFACGFAAFFDQSDWSPRNRYELNRGDQALCDFIDERAS